jgi:hypothetical protein
VWPNLAHVKVAEWGETPVAHHTAHGISETVIGTKKNVSLCGVPVNIAVRCELGMGQLVSYLLQNSGGLSTAV